MDTYLLEWMSTYLLNLPKWWFTGVPNMIKNFVYIRKQNSRHNTCAVRNFETVYYDV